MKQENTDRQIEIFRLQADFCKSLAEPKRLMAVHELRRGPHSVGELAARLGLRQSTTSQLLAILRQSGVITSTRHGNTVYYRLKSPKIARACDIVREVITEGLKEQHELGLSYINALAPEAENVQTE